MIRHRFYTALCQVYFDQSEIIIIVCSCFDIFLWSEGIELLSNQSCKKVSVNHTVALKQEKDQGRQHFIKGAVGQVPHPHYICKQSKPER